MDGFVILRLNGSYVKRFFIAESCLKGENSAKKNPIAVTLRIIRIETTHLLMLKAG
jgi:hypothetical protein